MGELVVEGGQIKKIYRIDENDDEEVELSVSTKMNTSLTIEPLLKALIKKNNLVVDQSPSKLQVYNNSFLDKQKQTQNTVIKHKHTHTVQISKNVAKQVIHEPIINGNVAPETNNNDLNMLLMEKNDNLIKNSALINDIINPPIMKTNIIINTTPLIDPVILSPVANTIEASIIKAPIIVNNPGIITNSSVVNQPLPKPQPPKPPQVRRDRFGNVIGRGIKSCKITFAENIAQIHEIQNISKIPPEKSKCCNIF